MTRALAALLLLATACSTSDLCAGHDGTCIGVTIVGNVGPVNRLDFDLLAGGHPYPADASSTKDLALPTTTALHLAAGIDGPVTLTVTAYRGDEEAGTGSASSADVREGEHVELTVELTGPDGGTPVDAGPDHGATARDLGRDAAEPPDMTYVLCPTAANVFCDAFDPTGMLPDPDCPAGVGSLTVDTTQPEWVGSYLDADRSAMSDNSECVITQDLMASSGDVWIRFYAYTASLPAANNEVEIMALEGATPNMGLGITSVAPLAETAWTALGVATVAPPNVSVKPGIWQCIEAHVDFAGQSFTVYVDGQLASTIDYDLNPIDSFHLGIVGSPSESELDFHFDDLAIGTTGDRIGCD